MGLNRGDKLSQRTDGTCSIFESLTEGALVSYLLYGKEFSSYFGKRKF
jgi:hypothetical protein